MNFYINLFMQLTMGALERRDLDLQDWIGRREAARREVVLALARGQAWIRNTGRSTGGHTLACWNSAYLV